MPGAVPEPSTDFPRTGKFVRPTRHNVAPHCDIATISTNVALGRSASSALPGAGRVPGIFLERRCVHLLLTCAMRLGATLVLALLTATSVRAQGDLRPSVVDVEWRTATGFERCAAVITARRAGGAEAWTAGHCAQQPFSVVRFFNGYEIYGSSVRVLERSGQFDAARLLLPLDPARLRAVTPVVKASAPPPLGTTLTVIGHPVSALRGPATGLWTTTYARMGETAADQATGAPEYEIYCPLCGPGNSGSGVFDPAGHLIGIVYGVTEIENVAGGRLPDGLYADVVPAAALR